SLKLSDSAYDPSYYHVFHNDLFASLSPNGVAVMLGGFPNSNDFFATKFVNWGTSIYAQSTGGWVSFYGGDIEGAGAGIVINAGANNHFQDFYMEEIGARDYDPIYAVWQASWPYIQGATVLDSNGHTQVCIQAGTSGSSVPSWNATYGGTTTDGGAVWRTLQYAQVVYGTSNAKGNVVDGAFGPTTPIEDYSGDSTLNYQLLPPTLSGLDGLVPFNFTARQFTVGKSLGTSPNNFISIDADGDLTPLYAKWAGRHCGTYGFCGLSWNLDGFHISSNGQLLSGGLITDIMSPTQPSAAFVGSGSGTTYGPYYVACHTRGGVTGFSPIPSNTVSGPSSLTPGVNYVNVTLPTLMNFVNYSAQFYAGDCAWDILRGDIYHSVATGVRPLNGVFQDANNSPADYTPSRNSSGDASIAGYLKIGTPPTDGSTAACFDASGYLSTGCWATQTNSTNNSSQTVLNMETSTTNAVGLTVTPVNPSGGIEKFEVTGGSYTGNAATASALATYTNYSVYGSGNGVGSWITPTANGQCLMSGASNYGTTIPSFQTCPTTTSLPWSSLTNPASSLSLTMGAYTSTFSTTTAEAQMFAWKNTTAATSSLSQGSPFGAYCGRAYTTTDTEDCMTLSELPGNGANAPITFNLGHTGASTGAVTLKVAGNPVMMNPFTVQGQLVTSDASLNAAYIAADANTNHVLHAGGSPGFGAIATADLPTIPITGGGTNATSAAAGTIPNATSSSASSWTSTPTLGNQGTAAGSLTMAGTTGTSGAVTLNGGTSGSCTLTVALTLGTLSLCGTSVTPSDILTYHSPATGIARTASGGQTVASAELSGDCTTSGSNAVTCTKTNGTSFVASATTDTTNAANITSGVFTTAREPNTTVNSISNDTNVTGSITAQNLTLGWTGQLSIARGGTGQSTAAAAFNALSPLTNEGDLSYYHSSSNTRLAIGGANTFLTSNGTDPSWGSLTGAGFGSQSAYSWFGNATGSSANPSFNTTAMPVSMGGTGLSSLTTYNLLIGNGASAPTLLAPSSTSGVPLISQGSSANPVFGALNLAGGSSLVTGTLPVGNGGLNLTSITAYDLIIGNGTSAPTLLAPSSTSGVPLVSQGSSSNPAYGTVVVAGGGTGLTTLTSHDLLIGNGTSAVTLLAPSSTSGVPLVSQGSSSNPTFSALNLGGGSSIVTGTVSSGNLPSTLVYTGQTNTYSSGNKQTFGASTGGAASINTPAGTAPTTPAAGDHWYDGDRMYVKDAETNSSVVSSVPRRFTITTAVTATSTTAQTVGTFAVAASKTYCLMCQLFIQSSSTSNTPTMLVTCPTSPTASQFGFVYAPSATSTAQANAACGTTMPSPTATTTTGSTLINSLNGMLQNGTTAGSLTIQVESSGSYNTIIEPGSFCILY
ncbi:MAG: hypothetical protein ABSA59_18065, partial [Terriglobia bacterium]